MSEKEETFTVNDWQNKKVSNLLEKGRYPFEVEKIKNHTGPATMGVWLDVRVEGKLITDYLTISDLQGKKTQWSWKWNQFLFSIGFRNPNKRFEFTTKDVVGKKGLCDVSVKEEKNIITHFSPVEEATAPLTDVPPEENPPASEPEKKKEETTEDNDI